MTYRHIQVRPLSSALGAEIGGVDPARPLQGEVFSDLRGAFLDNLVIFFRVQSLSPDQQVSRRAHRS